MIYTLYDNNGSLVIDFDVKYSTIEERYVPINITEKGKCSPIELTDKQYDKVLDYLVDYEGEEDLLTPWLFGANFLEKY